MDGLAQYRPGISLKAVSLFAREELPNKNTAISETVFRGVKEMRLKWLQFVMGKKHSLININGD